ncbi:hypothetical protein F5Y01DRAFT_297839 [Xylaria sp. FL0043]|nr:hypothetical protein F5Y01DRAFT_297839 [Xylaria sp. FL0043]
MPRTRKASTEGDPAPKRGAKRQSTDATEAEGSKRTKKSKLAEPDDSKEEEKQRLTTPDLEFDYDRSQLRDPRPTPGRVRRPRLDELELTDEFRQRFSMPGPERPKGRLNAFQRGPPSKEQTLQDPSNIHHDLHVCYKKGPRGRPTYDTAGFQLDFKKVAEWMKPKPYNKSRMVGAMEKSVARRRREEQKVFEIFFVDGDGPDSDGILHTFVMEYVKDHISKDLGVPWHQIDAKRAREWQERGFEKKKFSEWWHEPNKEEQKRMMKMEAGSSLRKDL